MNNRFRIPFSFRKVTPLAAALMLTATVPNASFLFANGQISLQTNIEIQETISGKIEDANGPVAGVTVSLKENPSVVTTTNASGQFTINAAVGQSLFIREVGYTSVIILISSNYLNICF